jgi:membrane associated rhomboid family serine protease
MPITYLIIGVTALISIACLNNRDLFLKLMHWPYVEARQGEYHRWLSSGFLHADYGHLIFNMLTLFFFGPIVEDWFSERFPEFGKSFFLFFYLLSIVMVSSATYNQHKNNQGYSAIGASGATSAVLFACIMLNPTIGIGLFFIPIPIPGFIFGALYIWYSSYMEKRGQDNIGHSAHLFGAVFGFFFPLFFDLSLGLSFFEKIMAWLGSF